MLVAGVDEVEKVRGDGHGELGSRQDGPSPFGGGEIGNETFELLEGGDAVLELPAPIIPVGVRHFRPCAAASGLEDLQGRVGW